MEPVGALQERLLRLEVLLYGPQGKQRKPFSSSNDNLLSKVQALQQGLHRHENNVPNLYDFYPKCALQ